MTRRRLLWLTGAVALVIGASRLPVYFGHETRNQLQVLWSQQKAYVCAGRATYGGRVTLGGTLWCRFMAYWAPKWCYADRERRDLVVAEIDPHNVKQTLLRGFSSGGGCYIYGGALHYAIGVRAPEDYPADWRWSGDTFQRLPKDEALRMRATYRYTTELIAREGWHEEIYWTHGQSWTFTIPGVRAVIEVRQEPATAVERVVLSLESGAQQELMANQKETRRLASSEYWLLPMRQ